MRRAINLASLLALLWAPWSFGATDEEYTVFESGAVRVLRLVAPDQVVDVDEPGLRLTVRPQVTVPVARRALVPALARQ